MLRDEARGPESEVVAVADRMALVPSTVDTVGYTALEDRRALDCMMACSIRAADTVVLAKSNQ